MIILCFVFIIISIVVCSGAILKELDRIEDKIDKLPHVTEQEEN